MTKRKEEMTTMKVQKDLAQDIYTLAAAKSVAATKIIEEAVTNYFERELKSVRNIRQPADNKQENDSQ